MTHAETDPDLAFTPVERAFIRDELDQVFSTLPTVAEGIWLRTLMGGPRAGQPRVPSRAQGLLARGLLRLDEGGRRPRLYSTGKGLAALRAMMGPSAWLRRSALHTSASSSALILRRSRRNSASQSVWSHCVTAGHLDR